MMPMFWRPGVNLKFLSSVYVKELVIDVGM